MKFYFVFYTLTLLTYKYYMTTLLLHYLHKQSRAIIQSSLVHSSCMLTHFSVKISRLHIVLISALRWTEFHQIRKDQMREIQRFPNLGHNLWEMIRKLYTIISNKLWDLSLYFGDLCKWWVLTSQQKALGPCKCARFRAMQTYTNYSFSKRG